MELSFITGVSRFSKVSLFSGLNNLVDLTLDPGYSAICGCTEADLDRVFAPELPGLDRDEIRAWYDGYGWLGDEHVYNPFGLLKLFRSRRFEAHWFETGTPTYLVDTLIGRGRRRCGPRRLYDVLAEGDAAGVEAPLRALLAGIPHDWHRRNEIARYEGYWASVFYAHFAALGLDVAAEDATSRGRLDLALRLGAHAYLFEFKVADASGSLQPAGAGGRPRVEDRSGAWPN